MGTMILVIALAWLVVTLLAALFQRQLIYLPDTTAPAPPDDVEVVAVSTSDRLDLEAWFLPTEDAVSTVLLAPGNAGNRGLRVPIARELNQRGHNVVLMDPRGYGGNPGRPSEQGFRIDARAVRDAVIARDDVDEDRLVYLGESIGTGVVAGLAVEHPPATLVLRSPFPELADVARRTFWFLPVRTLLRDRYPIREYLQEYQGPVLVVAGARDTIVPTALSREVAEQAAARYVEVADADHNDPALFTGAEFLDAVDEHIRTAIAGSSSREAGR